MAQWGLPVNSLGKRCDGADAVVNYYQNLLGQRAKLPYDIDGIVVKVDDLELQKRLGFIARSPRWAMAAKYAPQQAETVIKKIEIQVGRTGALTPVAIMEPVQVGGVTITHATLHNQDEIDRKDIREHDTVIIQRAGDVIPEIVRVVLERREPGNPPFKIPNKCPACGTPARRLEGEAVARCENPLCQARTKESLKHFVSRRAMNVERLGDKLIDQLVDADLAKKFSDLYRLDEAKLSRLQRQGEKSISNLLESIEKSKNTTLARLIFAMGIRFVGEQTAKNLARRFSTVEAFLKATKDELLATEDVGVKVAESIITNIQSPQFAGEMRTLLKLGVEPTPPEGTKSKEGTTTSAVGKASLALNGLTFVITGTIAGMSRDEVQDLIESHGGNVSSSVSKKTNFVVCGDDPGSKRQKAEELGVPLISITELRKLLR